jgi:hypothetical protein
VVIDFLHLAVQEKIFLSHKRAKLLAPPAEKK